MRRPSPELITKRTKNAKQRFDHIVILIDSILFRIFRLCSTNKLQLEAFATIYTARFVLLARTLPETKTYTLVKQYPFGFLKNRNLS